MTLDSALPVGHPLPGGDMWSWWLACAPDAPAHRPRGDGPDEPDWTAPVTSTPDLAALDLTAALQEAQATLVALDVTPLFAAYDEAVQGADGYCPAIYGYDYGESYVESWYAQCTAYDGDVFSGYANDYQERDYRGLGVQATVLTRAGHTLTAVGYWGSYEADYGSARYRGDYFDGPFSWDGPDSRQAWYARGIVPRELSLEWNVDGRGDLQGFTANGQLSSLGGAFDTFDFDAWEWRAGCGEPSGRVSVRTSDAVWLDVTFGGEGAARCDGCGEVSWRGQVLGEACDDFDGFRQAVMP